MVFIAWVMDPKSQKFSTLGGYAGTRYYEKNEYDPRLPSGLPYFKKAAEALAHMIANPGLPGMCQVDEVCADRFGMKAPPVRIDG